MSLRFDRQFGGIALAYAAFILVGISAGVGGVLIPAQIVDYGVDKAAIGLTFFTFAAGFFAAGSTAGPLIHRLGTRAVLVLGGGSFVAAALYSASRPAFAAFVVAQLLAGYGGGMMESVLNAYLAELPGATSKLNRLHAFFGVGALIGPLLAAWMLTFTSWTSVFLVLAGICAPLALGFWLVLPAALGAGHHVQTSPAQGDEPPRRGLLATTLRQPAVLLGAAFLAVYVGLEIGLGTWVFSYLTTGRGEAELAAGYAVSGYWLGLTVGRFVISPVATRIGLTPVTLTFACLAGVAVSTALVWVAPTVALASTALVLLGFFLGPIFPTTMAVMPSLTSPRLLATAIGITNGISVVGGAALPWVAGVLAQSVGVWTLLPFTLALGVFALALWWLVAQRVAAPDAARTAVEAAAS